MQSKPTKIGDTFTHGDIFTIAGMVKVIPNPDREWWHFWKPRMVKTSELAKFTIVGIGKAPS